MKKANTLTLIIAILLVQTSLFSQNITCEPDASNRTQVLENNIPNSYTCYMEMRRGWFSTNRGTGMLIHPRVVLTAGHNTAFYLFSKSFPYFISSVQNVTMYFGSIDKDNYLVKQSVRLKKGKTKFFNNGYWASGAIDKDFSIIILPDETVYNAVGGHYALSPITSKSDIGETIHMTGSPGDKELNEIWTEQTSNFEIKQSKLSYDLYTVKRNSGSPVWFINSNNQFQLAGVHSRGVKSEIGCNSAVSISQETYNKIVKWCLKAGIDLN